MFRKISLFLILTLSIPSFAAAEQTAEITEQSIAGAYDDGTQVRSPYTDRLKRVIVRCVPNLMMISVCSLFPNRWTKKSAIGLGLGTIIALVILPPSLP